MLKQNEAARLKAEQERDVKVAKLTENDDIEAYLTTFERLMIAYEVKPERWAYKLTTASWEGTTGLYWNGQMLVIMRK